MNKELNIKIHFYLTCLLAFLIPVLPAVIPAAIVLLVLNWLAGGNFLGLFRKKTGLFYFLLLISLYLLYVAGMGWSDNTEYGLKDLETKLSLLIFPVIYFSSDRMTGQKTGTVFSCFLYGCLAASVICFGNAVYQYFNVQYLLSKNIWAFNYGIDFFLKDRLSIWIHPSYISMYFVMALAGMHWIKPGSVFSTPWKKYAIAFTLAAFILLFSSKAGIVSLLLWGIYWGWHLVTKEKKRMQVFLGAASVAGVFLTLYFTAPQFALRINSTIHTLSENTGGPNSEESTASRIAIWKAARSVIAGNLPAGTGTGDAKDELMNEYEKQGMSFALQEKLNAHSQFLQTFIALGIPGILLLCAGFFLPFIREWKRNNYLYITFIILILLNTAAESMFETQAGVVFYAFFNSLLLFSETETT